MIDVSQTLSRGFLFLDLAGVFTGAVAGALVARRKPDYDVVGVGALALASGLGGGLLRDTLLQRGTPVALTHPTYLLLVLSGFALAWFFGGLLGPGQLRVISIVDALSLGWFAVASSLRTFEAGLGPLPILLLGVVGATGGGLSRDVLGGDVPSIFRKGELYALAALAASATWLALQLLAVPRLFADLAGVSVGAGVRLLSLRFGWRAPLPH